MNEFMNSFKMNRILIIDDNPLSSLTMQIRLKIVGYDSITEIDPKKIIKLSQKEKFSLIIADYPVINRMDIDIIGKIKEMNPGIKVIKLTPSFSQANAKEQNNENLSFTLIKPIDLDKLIFILNYLEKNQAGYPNVNNFFRKSSN